MDDKKRSPARRRELKEQFLQALKDFQPLAEDLSSWLFQHPEISSQEHRSSERIMALLDEQGWLVQRPPGGPDTAFLAQADQKVRERKLALMVEYDALPDIGHACGHNVSAAISLLAALALRPLQDDLDASVHLIGTPAEERGGGKALLIEKGYFQGCDLAMMVHLYDCNLLSPLCLALHGNTFRFTGRPAHAAASPWEGANALNGVQLLFHAVDMLRQHVRPQVRMHGIIREGGTIPNTVPEVASCEFSVRSLLKSEADQVQDLVNDCARGAALATQTQVSIQPAFPSYADLRRNEPGLEILAGVYAELGLELDGDPERIFASTDAGNVSYVCPTFHPCLAIAPAGTPLHTQAFARLAGGPEGKAAIPVGASIIGLQVLSLFTDDQALARVAQAFKEG